MAISLLPHEATKKRTEEKVKRFSFLGAISLLLGVCAVSAGVFIFKATILHEVGNLETGIEVEKKKISAQKDLEIKAQTLEKKAETLEKVLLGMTHYSTLLDALNSITPSEVALLNISALSSKKASISGTASSYLGLARFVKAFDDPEKGVIFSEVTLRSVSLETKTGQVKFSLEVKIKEEAL